MLKHHRAGVLIALFSIFLLGACSSEKETLISSPQLAQKFAQFDTQSNVTEQALAFQKEVEAFEKQAETPKEKGQVRLYKDFIEELMAQEEGAEEAKEKYAVLNQVHQKNLSDEIRFNVAYHPKELAEVKKVREDFGVLTLPVSLEETDLEVSTKPWSGYWYPYSQANLLYEKDRPLYKLDQILKKKRMEYGAVQHELENLEGLEPDAWEGHCFPWAMASVLFNEPKTEKVFGRVKLSVADQKALLVKAVEIAPFKQYGIRYEGNAETDGTFQDLRPEAFHRVLVDHLENDQPFLIDDDPGIEVWTKPVFGAKYPMPRVMLQMLSTLQHLLALFVRKMILKKNSPAKQISIGRSIPIVFMYLRKHPLTK